MELDELKRRWEAQSRKLDEVLKLNRQLELGAVRTALQRLRAGLWVELAMDVAALLLLGGSAGALLSAPRFAIPALALFALAVGELSATIRQLARLGAVDYGAPVVEIQRRLEAVGAARIRGTQRILLLSPLIWALLLVVGPRLFGVDAYAALGVPYLLANLALGLALPPVAVVLARRYADRLDRSPFVRRLARDVAGKGLGVARERLARLAAFEREDG